MAVSVTESTVTVTEATEEAQFGFDALETGKSITKGAFCPGGVSNTNAKPCAVASVVPLASKAVPLTVTFCMKLEPTFCSSPTTTKSPALDAKVPLEEAIYQLLDKTLASEALAFTFGTNKIGNTAKIKTARITTAIVFFKLASPSVEITSYL
jgi:hypothetical protein